MIIVERENERHRAAFLASDLRSVTLYRTFHPAHAYAQYLSSVRCLSNRRLISRFRSGCHGLHVDTGRFAKDGHRLQKENRVCHVGHSAAVEDQQHFLLGCPAYSHLHAEHAELFQAFPCTVASVMHTSNTKRYPSRLPKPSGVCGVPGCALHSQCLRVFRREPA